jgi:hypothetical protein
MSERLSNKVFEKFGLKTVAPQKAIFATHKKNACLGALRQAFCVLLV